MQVHVIERIEKSYSGNVHSPAVYANKNQAVAVFLSMIRQSSGHQKPFDNMQQAMESAKLGTFGLAADSIKFEAVFSDHRIILWMGSPVAPEPDPARRTMNFMEKVCAAIAEVRFADGAMEWRAACDECMDRIRDLVIND